MLFAVKTPMVAEKEAKIMKRKELNSNSENRIRIKNFCHRMSLVYNPITALTFVTIYWAVGLKNENL